MNLDLDSLIAQLVEIRRRRGNMPVAVFNHARPMQPKPISKASVIRVSVGKDQRLTLVDRMGKQVVEIL